MFALFINAAILIMAAATFHGTGHEDVAEIGDAYQLLVAAARHDDGEHPVRGGAALLGPERDADRHAGRADRDGRLHQPAHPSVAAPPDHAAHRDRAGRSS